MVINLLLLLIVIINVLVFAYKTFSIICCFINMIYRGTMSFICKREVLQIIGFTTYFSS